MSLWPRHHLIVLFGADSRCGAIDLESKLTESALGAVQLADYRNFAHGRHHWLAKRASTTGVLAYVSSHDKILAERTLQLLPGEVPIVRIGLRHEGIDANLEAAIVALWLTACAGEAHHVNAGRPGVPKFGREIYHLHAFGRSASGSSSSVESTAIERKVGTSITTLQKRSALAFWRDKYRAFIRTLRRSEFSGIVLDYDGTLCDGRDRFVGWSAEMASEVVRLLQAGIHVAIATGRGESVRTDLRGRIPEERWTRVLVGYCNGAEVHPLSSERPVCRGKQMALLKGIVQAIQQNPALRQTVKYKVYPSQISLRPKSPVFGDYVWEALQDLMPVREHPTIQVVRSDHSIDILAPGVSKTRILDCMRSLIGVPGARILCIGDKGRWPGNDSGLLSQALSLSVDEVSRSPETCWNIAPLGYRGAQATLYYLRHLDPVCMAALPGCRCRLPGGRK